MEDVTHFSIVLKVRDKNFQIYINKTFIHAAENLKIFSSIILRVRVCVYVCVFVFVHVCIIRVYTEPTPSPNIIRAAEVT